ncbi:hypothetical protein RDI58_015553 [Solanum bulbocastanum]|uniref:Uncharacterized protein n=1 Tax=Solanum bulbocastanum TaxID=147425 RepID=A0AAN8TLS3_SOLBU
MKFIKLTLLNIKLYLKVSQVSLLSHYSSHRLPLRTPTTGAQPPSPRTGATPPSPTMGATHHRSSSGGRLQQQRRSPTAEEARVSSRRCPCVNCENVRGSVYGYREKAYQKKKSWYCGSSSSSFDGGDRETISAMESKIAYLNAELAAVAEREKKREEELQQQKR